MNTKVILNVRIARRLIQEGCKVVDIKPHHERPQSTVFVFEDSEEYPIQELIEKHKKIVE